MQLTKICQPDSLENIKYALFILESLYVGTPDDVLVDGYLVSLSILIPSNTGVLNWCINT